MKKFILLFCFLLYTLYFIPVASAASEFSSSYDFIYEVSESGLTKVTQQIGLTNLTTNYYASEYSLTFGSEKITDIKANDNLGPLKPEITYQNGATVIHVSFNEKVLGIAKTLKWQLTYNSTAIAQQEGRIWKINLPKIFKDDDPANYNVKLILPMALGEPSYVNPEPKSKYFWTKDEGAKNGISLTFGDWQGYHFTQTYSLKNVNFLPEISEIVLPQTTAFQEIILETISPKPFEISADEKGNRLAAYFLWPKQNLEIKVFGFAKVFTYPFLFQGETGQIETNFVSQIPQDRQNKFAVEKETLWQKLWIILLKR